MKLKWTRRALEQFIEAQDYIARNDSRIAQQVARRVAASARLLLTQPFAGRTGRVSGTREWVVRRTPYLLVYVLHEDELRIVRLLHGKQHWPPEPAS